MKTVTNIICVAFAMFAVRSRAACCFFVITAVLGLVATNNAVAQTCAPPPPNMVSWWPGEGNANDIQGTNNGTLNGVTFAPGKVGQAFSCGGGDRYVDVGTNLSSIGGDISVVTWIKTGPNSFYQYIAGNRTPTPPYEQGWELACLGNGDGGTIAFYAGGGAHGYRTGLSNTRDNQWHHVAGVRNGATYSVYVDGVIENGVGFSDASDISSTAPLYIGKTSAGADPVTRFAGLVDEFQVYNRALSASEVQAIYNAGSEGTCRPCIPPPPNMVSWWPGDGNANDIQGGNDGILQNGATFAYAKVDQAFFLDGIDDLIDAGNPANLQVSNGDFTVDAWVKFNALSHLRGNGNGAPSG